MGLRLKNLKNLNFRGGEEFMEHQDIGGLPKKGACTVCRLKRELGEKELGGVFEAELTPQCTLWPLTWAVHMFIASRNLKKKKN